MGDSQVIGKNAGSDAAQNKPNFVTLLGLDGAGEYLKSTHKLALDAIASFDSRADLLRAIATYVVERNK